MSKVDKMEKDSFWDIQKLIPPKKEPVVSKLIKKEPHFAEIHVGGENNVSAETTISASEKHEAAPHSYSYEKLSSLIRRVEVIDWKNSYHYYEYFCKNALYFRDKKGEKCERVPFFSYVAQYSQMSREQLAWYLWWRENAQNGVYLDTNVSYVLLYFYEVINLGDVLDTRKTLSNMIGIWAHYRDLYPQLDSCVAEWICDYSLIHQIPIPFPHKQINRDMISRCSLREVYYSFDPSDWVLYAKFLLTYCNAYNYRKSKFYVEETAAIYDEHIVGALSVLLRKQRAIFLDGKCHLRKVSRVAFTGALCSYRMRKKIEVEYLSLSDTEELRDTITSIIKYCENKLRVCLGIRSRLGVREIDSSVLDVLDDYFAQNGFVSDRPFEKNASAEYEKLYEVKDTAFSLEKAIEIERSSWNTTAKLVEELEDNVSSETKYDVVLPNPVASEKKITPRSAFEKAISQYAEFFDYVLGGKHYEQIQYCRMNGFLPDAVVDEINEMAVEHLGDILIEENDGGYIVIEDYRSIFEDKGDAI